MTCWNQISTEVRRGKKRAQDHIRKTRWGSLTNTRSKVYKSITKGVCNYQCMFYCMFECVYEAQTSWLSFLYNQPRTSLIISNKKHKSNKAVPLIKPSSTVIGYSKREYSSVANTLKCVVPSHSEFAYFRNAGRRESPI